MPLRLYANGLMLFEGPFRKFTDPTAKMLIKDLSDGYFPWELKERYPEGVPFSVVDKRCVPKRLHARAPMRPCVCAFVFLRPCPCMRACALGTVRRGPGSCTIRHCSRRGRPC